MGSIFKAVAAFEDFALKYGHYHLNESMPELSITNSRLSKYKLNFQYPDLQETKNTLYQYIVFRSFSLCSLTRVFKPE